MSISWGIYQYEVFSSFFYLSLLSLLYERKYTRDYIDPEAKHPKKVSHRFDPTNFLFFSQQLEKMEEMDKSKLSPRIWQLFQGAMLS